jgi:N-acetylneuraminate synthase
MKMDIIAEVGSVHDGSFGNACKLIELAKDVGATTVKFQMHLAEHETTQNAPTPKYFKTEPRYKYFKRTEFSIQQWKKLYLLAQENNIEFCCSPFSLKALEILIDIGIKKIKIASGEVTNIPLLKIAALESQEVILSSGMSSWSELDHAMNVLDSGKASITVMQCSSEYPCRPENVGLNIVSEISDRYKCKAGFSDHTIGYAASIGAVYFGAETIEKHLTFSRAMYGSDAKHSMEPEEFRQLVVSLNQARKIYTHPITKNNADIYRDMKDIFEKSLVAAEPLAAGTQILSNHIAYKKPGTGLKPIEANRIIGRVLKNDVPLDHLFHDGDFI